MKSLLEFFDRPAPMVQYKHMNRKMYKDERNYPSYTFAAVTPNVKDVIKAATKFLKGESAEVTMELGITRVSRKDTYSKKTGRTEAEKRLKEVTMQVKSVNNNGGDTYVELVGDTALITLSARPDKPLVKLQYVRLNSDEI